MTTRPGTPEHEVDPSLLRPFVITRGRTQPARGAFALITQAIAVAEVADRPAPGLDPEHAAILRLSRAPIAVAELASHLDLPPGAICVLLGDLLEHDLIDVQHPHPDSDIHDPRVYKAVLDGLRSL
ncbi:MULTISPECIES: DUF742 domain-containing protein [unclassified Nonomuraea]|uniref:DUF742 domain-containing protein n=1 Tax=Nonomuraea sp. NPDC003804 TaxID=3154547 RepID=UPI0033A54A97